MDNLDEILKNSSKNLYFFLSQEANSPNNASTNLGNLISKAKEIAKIIGRHINLYGFNKGEGINFICRVMPTGEALTSKMSEGGVIIASEINLVKCELAKEDVEKVMRLNATPELTKDMIKATQLSGMKPPAKKFIKSPYLKQSQKDVQEDEDNLTEIYNEGGNPSLKTMYSDDTVTIEIKD